LPFQLVGNKRQGEGGVPAWTLMDSRILKLGKGGKGNVEKIRTSHVGGGRRQTKQQNLWQGKLKRRWWTKKNATHKDRKLRPWGVGEHVIPKGTRTEGSCRFQVYHRGFGPALKMLIDRILRAGITPKTRDKQPRGLAAREQECKDCN